MSRYRYNSLPADQPGRYIYLRRKDTGEFWGATWQPTRTTLEHYECRHGAGYSRITTQHAGIRAEVLYFVPPTPPTEACPAELWVVRLTNTTDESLVVQTFSYVELSFVSALNDQHNLDWAGHIVSSAYDGANHAIVAGTRFQKTRQFFASDRTPRATTATGRPSSAVTGGWRRRWLWSAGSPGAANPPAATASGHSATSAALAPGRRASIIYLLGITDAPEPSVVTAPTTTPGGEGCFRALRADWDGYRETLQRSRPDAASADVNYLAPLQCRATLYWSRFVSGYETGLGPRNRNPRHRPGHLRGRPRRPRRGGRPPGEGLGACSSPTVTPGTSTSRSRTRGARSRRREAGTAPVVQRRPPLARARHLQLPEGDRRLPVPHRRPCPTPRAEPGGDDGRRVPTTRLGPHDGGGGIHPRPPWARTACRDPATRTGTTR